MQSLTSEEIAEWKRICERQRSIARTSPCYVTGQVLSEAYNWRMGPWNFCLTLDRFLSPPSWHGTVSMFQEIGTEAVHDQEGHRLFEVPQDALLSVQSWDHEVYDTARDLLGEVFSGLVLQKDTPVTQIKGLFCVHWLVSEKDAGTLN